MASFLHRLPLERACYILAGVFGLLGALGYGLSYTRDNWSEHLPVLPFFLVVLAGSCTLTAVTLSLVRLFHQDRQPEDEEPSGPSGFTDDVRGAGGTKTSRHADGPEEDPRG